MQQLQQNNQQLQQKLNEYSTRLLICQLAINNTATSLQDSYQNQQGDQSSG
jgi:hypothetical protein